MNGPVLTYTFALGWRPLSSPRKTPAQIVAEVAEKHGVTVAELKSDCRRRIIAWPRQEAMYRLYRETSWSLPKIGGYLGDRDHTTILKGIRRHEARMAAAEQTPVNNPLAEREQHTLAVA